MSDNHNPGVPECDLADGTIAALRARVAELQAELNRSDCGDRNHAGLEDVMTGARLPNAELGQNVAFLAGLLGAAEQKVRDLEAKLAEVKGCDHLDAPYRKALERVERLRSVAKAGTDLFNLCGRAWGANAIPVELGFMQVALAELKEGDLDA